jgi:hypothetical protein
MAKVITYYEFSMAFVEFHASNIAIKDVSKNSHWFSISSIPNLYRALTSDVEFKSDWRVQRALDWVVIRSLWYKGLLVFENFENTRTTNKSAMLWYHS